MDPRRSIEACAALAQHLAATWAGYEATEAMLGAPTMTAAMGGGTRGSDHPDPTASIVITHQPYFEVCAEITEALGHLRAAQRRMDTVQRQTPVGAEQHDHFVATVKASRCSGRIDPTCNNNSVVRDGKHAGLCWTCIKRVQRSDKD